MYGEKVHKSVIENGEKESGITIHYVNRDYDSGDIIFQARCKVEKDDTAETLASKIHALEYEYYPKVIEEVIGKLPEY
jgi:phosphoribosylglycinamide formyltransferase-1